MNNSTLFSKTSRIGYHYFPDTLHYSEGDVSIWLPELKKMGASWMTLIAPLYRAIPEHFISAVKESEIEPIIHFITPVDLKSDQESFKLLFRNYARWGVRYISVYDRPNNRQSWTAPSWAQTNLVERFLDLFIPLANDMIEEGLTPVFPPLQPGGDFWDTAFLRTALEGIQRRGQEKLIDNMAIGAYAVAGNRPIDWGMGGPERWPDAQPYNTPPGVQDQIGFRIFEWYSAISEDVIGRTLPILLLRAGYRPGDRVDLTWPVLNVNAHATRNMEIVELLSENFSVSRNKNSIPHEVLACNFWLFSANANSQYMRHAWFSKDGPQLPVVEHMRRWVAGHSIQNDAKSFDGVSTEAEMKSISAGAGKNGNSNNGSGKISHYILLPLYSWGVADWDLDLILPFVQENHPTIGFSLSEACLASHVTIVGSNNTFSEESVKMLQDAGCSVDRMGEDGIIFAS